MPYLSDRKMQDGTISKSDGPRSHITFFKDKYAKTKTEADLCLEEMAYLILNSTAPTKAELPWLKMATFGQKRTTEKSLRHDANVLNITGTELDYDREQIGYDAVLGALQELSITAILHTSASSKPDKPRWRIVAPTSRPLPPTMRKPLTQRLNGALKDKLGVAALASSESFTLSQSYYYGRLCDTPESYHRADVVTGTCIDLREDLATFEASGDAPAPKKQQEDGQQKKGDDGDGARGFDNIMAELGDGEGLKGFHDVLIPAIASYVVTNYQVLDEHKLKKLLRKAIDAAPKKPDRAAEDIARYRSDKFLDDAIKSAISKYIEENRVLTTDDFVYVLDHGQFIFTATNGAWPRESVDSKLKSIPELNDDGSPKTKAIGKGKAKRTFPSKLKASEFIKRKHSVEQMCWCPGEDKIIKGRILHESGWIERPSVSALNAYNPPTIEIDRLGKVTADKIAPWLDHLKAIYPDDWQHILNFLAHRRQKPGEKINHALFLGGNPGIGKDTILEAVRVAVGPWNWKDVAPHTILERRFNSYLQAVVTRINEARDTGESNRYTFYERMKTMCAAPPDVHEIDRKNIHEYSIVNVNSVIVTSNHLTDGLYLPPDDRRTYIAWSKSIKEEFTDEYWHEIWRWYQNENGFALVAAFLQQHNLSAFNPKAPPKQTEAFFQIASANITPEEYEIEQALEYLADTGDVEDDGQTPKYELERTKAIVIKQLLFIASEHDDLSDFYQFISERKNQRAVGYRLAQAGYTPVKNFDDRKGQWRIGTDRVMIYAKADLNQQERREAAQKLKEKAELRFSVLADNDKAKALGKVPWDLYNQKGKTSSTARQRNFLSMVKQ